MLLLWCCLHSLTRTPITAVINVPVAMLQGSVTDMREENVVQPLLVTSSALTLATECVRMILKVSMDC